MYSFYPYASDLPADAVQLVIDSLRNRAVDVKEAVHATYHMISYGLGVWDPHPNIVGATFLTADQAADVLEQTKLPQGVLDETVKALPWNMLLPLLLKLAERLLEQWLAQK